MFVTGSKVRQLAEAGVDFIHDKTTGIFHHKIAIIDKQVLGEVLMTFLLIESLLQSYSFYIMLIFKQREE